MIFFFSIHPSIKISFIFSSKSHPIFFVKSMMSTLNLKSKFCQECEMVAVMAIVWPAKAKSSMRLACKCLARSSHQQAKRQTLGKKIRILDMLCFVGNKLACYKSSQSMVRIHPIFCVVPTTRKANGACTGWR